jgi:small neutral amino acid transporter SnatA (MarC family)
MLLDFPVLAIPTARSVALPLSAASSPSGSPIPALPTFGCVGTGISSSFLGIQALATVILTYWVAAVVLLIIWLLWWSFNSTSWRGMSVPALQALSRLFGCLPVVLAILVMVYGIYTIFTKCGLT